MTNTPHEAAGDLRQRYADAIAAVLDQPNGMAYRGMLPAALMAVRDDELAALRRGLESVTDRMEADRLKHRAERDIWKECDEKQWLQIRAGEAATARVREIHRPIPCENARHDGGNGQHCAVCEYDDVSGNVWPCPTIRALDGQEADRA